MKVSVIIPVFNREELIRKCLDSIPDIEDIEVIVVNDGSTDGTWNAVNSYDRLQGKIKLLSQPNSGPGIARNTGLDNAQGDYIFFLDSDDYIYGDVFKEIIDKYVPSNYDIIWTARERNDGYTWVSPYSLQGCFVRRSFVNGARHSNKLHAEDTEFMWQLISKRRREVTISSPPVYHYNLNVNADGTVDGIEGSLTWKRLRGLLK